MLKPQVNQFLVRFSSIILQAFILFQFLFSSSYVSAKVEESQDSFQVAIDSISKQIKEDYNLSIVYQNIPDFGLSDVVYEAPKKEEYPLVLEYVKLFQEEISKYPKGFFNPRSFTQVYFVKRLFYRKRPVEGLYNFQKRFIMLDFIRSKERPLTQRHNIHHEFFHMMEVGFLGWKDPKWAEFNKQQFQYGNQNKGRNDPNPINYFAPPELGFVTHYSMTSTEEDKAEIFGSLMMEAQNKLLYRWAQKDPVLKSKVDYIKMFVFYYCPEMNVAYWEDLFKTKP